MKTWRIEVWFSIAVVIVLCVGGLPPPVQAEVTLQQAPSGPEGSWSTIMTEGFEGTWPAGLWSVYDGNGSTGGEVYWDDDDYKAHSGGWSAWCANGGANGRDPQYYYYPNDMEAWTTFGPFSLAGATDAELEFWVWNASEPGYDYFSWLASKDCVNYYGYSMSIPTDGWDMWTFDLTSVPTIGDLTGDSSVCIAFKFTSDYGITNVGAFVDDVVLRKYVPSTCYSLATSVSPAGSGTVTASPGPNCPDYPGKYLSGTTVTLTAYANAGYQFDHWSGDAGGSANPTTVVMNGNKSVTANLVTTAPCYELTLTTREGGGPPTAEPDHSAGCNTGFYHAGETITLTPDPDDGNLFWYFYHDEENRVWTYPPTFTMPARAATVGAYYWAPTTDIGVQAGVAHMALGSTAVMPLDLFNWVDPVVEVGAITVNWAFDPAKVQATGCELDPEGAFDGGECSIDNNSGLATLTAFSMEGVPGSALLGTITLLGVQPTAGWVYSTPDVVTLTDAEGDDIGGYGEFWGAYQVKSLVNGDVDCSGSLGITDAMFVLQHVVGLRTGIDTCPVDPEDELFLPACDVNGDGNCNVVDALFIAQCVDGGYTNPLCPARGLLRPGDPKPEIEWPAPQASVGLSLGAAEKAGETITVPIWLALDSQLLGAATVHLDLDPAMYALEGCTADPTGTMDLAMCQVDAARGQVRLTAIAAGGVSGNLVLATVSFRIVDGAPKDIAPILTAPVLVDPAGRPIEVVVRYGIVD